jgi:hypothetical protein
MKEYWRFNQNGLFEWWTAIWSDWRDESDRFPPDQNWRHGESLSVADVSARYSEIFELLARLATKTAPFEKVRVTVAIFGIGNRYLNMGSQHFSEVSGKYTTHIPDFPFSVELSQVELAANHRSIAERVAADLLARFGYSIPPQIVGEIRQRVRY